MIIILLLTTLAQANGYDRERVDLTDRKSNLSRQDMEEIISDMDEAELEEIIIRNMEEGNIQ